MLKFISSPLKIIPNLRKMNLNFHKINEDVLKNCENVQKYFLGGPPPPSSKKPYHSNNNHHNFRHQKLPKTPDLIYMPHLYRWIKTKLRFKYLQKMWDPEFSEGAFIYGSTQAVCRITEIINSGQEAQLEGLLTEQAKKRLTEDMNHRLTPLQKNIIRLKPHDIKIFVPMSVTFTKSTDHKRAERACRVGLRVLALKWFENRQNSANFKLVLVALQTEFWRDYSRDAQPDWTISDFSVLECVVLTESPQLR